MLLSAEWNLQNGDTDLDVRGGETLSLRAMRPSLLHIRLLNIFTTNIH